MARQVDRNSVRGGAGLSAVALLVAFGADVWPIVPVAAIAVGAGAVFGLRASPLGASFRFLKKAFRLRVPVELEDEPPPRFAQTLGGVVLVAATVAFLAGADTAGWSLALVVAALQTLLAVTGICVGCELYLFGKRLTSKGAHA